MKTVLRIIIILAAALAIAGVTLVAVNASGTGTAQFAGGGLGENHVPGSGEGWRQGGGPFAGGQGLRPQGDGFRNERGGAFAWAETLKNIVIIAILVLAAALTERLIRKLRKPKPVPVMASREMPGGKEGPIE
jgi:hypothetical protein